MSANVSPVAWYGGKSRLSTWIAGLLPQHDTYIEAFGGGAAVLFAKPRTTLEVDNDIDDGLVTFFRVLRDRPVELQRALRLTPYARAEFEHCRDSWASLDGELERARRWYAHTRMAFACSASSGWGFEVDGAHIGGTRASGHATAVENLPRFAERFRRVQVDKLDWRECLTRYDRPGGVFYVDPPYNPTRSGHRPGGINWWDSGCDFDWDLGCAPYCWSILGHPKEPPGRGRRSNRAGCGGPNEPFGDRSQTDMEALHWEPLVRTDHCGSVYVARMMRLAPLATDGHPYSMPIDRVSDSRATQTHR